MSEIPLPGRSLSREGDGTDDEHAAPQASIYYASSNSIFFATALSLPSSARIRIAASRPRTAPSDRRIYGNPVCRWTVTTTAIIRRKLTLTFDAY